LELFDGRVLLRISLELELRIEIPQLLQGLEVLLAERYGLFGPFDSLPDPTLPGENVGMLETELGNIGLQAYGIVQKAFLFRERQAQ
jgi:hypothetical protein